MNSIYTVIVSTVLIILCGSVLVSQAVSEYDKVHNYRSVKIMKKSDLNGDRLISLEEFLISTKKTVHDRKIVNRFRRIDNNKDGSVSYSELDYHFVDKKKVAKPLK